jgi:hypothetical protein
MGFHHPTHTAHHRHLRLFKRRLFRLLHRSLLRTRAALSRRSIALLLRRVLRATVTFSLRSLRSLGRIGQPALLGLF